MLIVCAGLVIPMLFLRRRWYFIVMGVLCLFGAPIEIASLYLNHSPASTTFVGLFYATNLQEAAGVITAIWPLALMVVVAWIAYFVISCLQPNEWMIPRKLGLWVLGIGLPLFFIGAILYFSVYARNIYNMHEPKEVLRLAKDLTLMKFNKIYPYNIYLNSCHLAAERRTIEQSKAVLESFRFGIEQKQDTASEVYVFVIGEAARSTHFSLNGYARPTNPRLSAHRNLVSYPHMYSQASTTEQAVPLMLSRVPVNRYKDVFAEKMLPEAFQEAGFETVWLTNQSRIVNMRRVLGTVDKRFESGKDMSTENNYDHLLLPMLTNTLEARGKQFIVVHTMGSHWRYDTRYPAEFEQFTPALGEAFQFSMISPDNKERLVNAYDNTILYTDYFLDSLLALVERQNRPAVVVYMSDHGENLYDDARQLILHGNYSASQWLFHVPLIVWFSDEYKGLHPEKIEQLHAHSDVCDNSSVLFHSLMDAAGLHYKNDTASSMTMRTRSIFSSDYCPPDTLFVLTAEERCVVFEQD